MDWSSHRSIAALLMLSAAALTNACDKKSEQPAPSTTPASPSSSAPQLSVSASPLSSALIHFALPSKNAITFAVDPKSTTSVDMPAPKEHIKAGTDGAAGSIVIDPTNLANTRGEVKIDLLTLKTKTFGDAEKDKKQTDHAKTWLEVSDGADGKLPDDVKATNRWTTYTIRSVDHLSATDLTKVAPTKDAADEVRTVFATTKGDFVIHGHKVMREADVSVAFHYAPGAPAEKPSFMVIKSTKPLRATLADHEVKPRDTFGKLATGAFNLLGTKVADIAEITLDLRASPQP